MILSIRNITTLLKPEFVVKLKLHVEKLKALMQWQHYSHHPHFAPYLPFPSKRGFYICDHLSVSHCNYSTVPESFHFISAQAFDEEWRLSLFSFLCIAIFFYSFLIPTIFWVHLDVASLKIWGAPSVDWSFLSYALARLMANTKFVGWWISALRRMELDSAAVKISTCWSAPMLFELDRPGRLDQLDQEISRSTDSESGSEPVRSGTNSDRLNWQKTSWTRFFNFLNF